ncbi:hypothetical protein NMY22_g488 [Coprinellus aureogranulatus]|nr:hypothetical protein NMY22_g488 [Coprinellus aureogranulatus]
MEQPTDFAQIEETPYTEEAFNNESLFWKALSENDLVHWEFLHAHKMPQPRAPADYPTDKYLQTYKRYRTWNHRTGFNIEFNRSFKCHTRREQPYVGSDTEDLGNEIWMAYYPLTQKDDDVILGAFSISNYSLQKLITNIAPQQYQLANDMITTWQKIEGPISVIASALRPLLTLPVTVRPPVFPSTHKYADIHRTHEAAFLASRKARTSWKYMSAYISFLLSFWHRGHLIDALVSWLSQVYGLNKKWLMVLIKFSQIADYDGTRRLGFSLSHTSPWVPYLPIFLAANIPATVSLGYTEEEELRAPSVWKEVWYFFKDSIPVHPRECECGDCPVYTGEHSNWVAMSPKQFVDERQGEWEELCTQLQISFQKRIAGVPVQTILEYGPFLEKWNVYEWVDTDDHGYERRLVYPEAASSIFNLYPPHERYFSPVYCEVDLCHNPPTPTACHVDKPSVPETSLGTQTSVNDADPSPYQRGGRETVDGEAHFDDVYDHEIESHRAANLPIPDLPWRGVLRQRMGFDTTGHFIPSPLTLPEGSTAEIAKVKRAIQSFGFQPDAFWRQIDDTERAWIMFPVRLLSTKHLALGSIPSQFDIASRDLFHSLSGFLIEPINQPLERLTIRRFVVGVQNGLPLQEQWFVLVVEPHILLEIARNGWTTIRQIARNLAKQGTEFHTARYFPPRTIPTIRPTERTGLGTINIGQEPYTAEDYKSYERVRESFLRSPRGHLALSMGGFPARLARDLVDINTVYQPPSSTAHLHGRVLGTNGKGEVLISDYVDQFEMDKLLGRYSMIEGARTNVVTLWPPMSVWEVMGNNTESWNQVAEFWFQARLSQCRSGDAIDLRTVVDWRQKCRLVKETRDIWKAYRRIAGDYLEAHWESV